jgi:ribosomal protein S18 acetylase RimI-like enzyme
VLAYVASVDRRERISALGVDVCFSTLNPFAASRYAPLTFPIYRPVLEAFTDAASIAGICASVDGKPVGLAIARVDSNQMASILSIYVAKAFRGRGIGSGLLGRLEIELAARGQTSAIICYVGETDGARVLERLLAARGWPPDGDRLLFFLIDGAITSAPWFDRAVLPPPFEIASWTTVTAGERTALAESQTVESWIPDALGPFSLEESAEPLNSLVLRYRGAIVGWLLTEAFTATTIRYVNLYVKPALNKAGRTFASLALLAEGVRRQARALGARSCGRFEVLPGNIALLRFIDRHLAPYVLERVEKERRIKRLAPVDGS